MKKAIIASVIGVVASVASVSSSYAQGHTWFDNYGAAPYMNVRVDGVGASSANIHVDLAYFIGTTTDPLAMTPLGLSVAINPALTALGAQGYWSGVIADIPGYTSGAVTFQVLAWDTTTGANYGAASSRGSSFLWQESSLPTGSTPASFWAGLPGPNGGQLANVTAVPEPSTFALIGLGTGALLFFRRRK